MVIYALLWQSIYRLIQTEQRFDSWTQSGSLEKQSSLSPVTSKLPRNIDPWEKEGGVCLQCPSVTSVRDFPRKTRKIMRTERWRGLQPLHISTQSKAIEPPPGKPNERKPHTDTDAIRGRVTSPSHHTQLIEEYMYFVQSINHISVTLWDDEKKLQIHQICFRLTCFRAKTTQAPSASPVSGILIADGMVYLCMPYIAPLCIAAEDFTTGTTKRDICISREIQPLRLTTQLTKTFAAPPYYTSVRLMSPVTVTASCECRPSVRPSKEIPSPYLGYLGS
ncbi:uncharacterized protein CLUP02_11050 [Colletotrichum lupini]|uniref:Uncharacterized protein n=1 Tax=Colletotrichum lupini TaxID=145971 RepID=A0A9Q8WJX9_9PEZI|nr:uncharacterized protein CLUP02_11050 [Colletotrichum lupini]UQC85552.1 hypothetical protein CLUP02_11050 [Colletotrichum lupini]